MDVFLVPVGRDAYELYCEDVDEPDDADAEGLAEDPPEGFFPRLKFRVLRPFRRLKLRFTEMLAEAERERRRGAAVSGDGNWAQRAKRRGMRWVAESIAEQRLLWNMRRQVEGRFYYPDDLTEETAVSVMRRQLGRDFDKHRFWLAIDSVLLVLSGLLVLVPGPNVLGYYFAFRVVGHYFSVRGARRGLLTITWVNCPSTPLAELRAALALDPAVRLQQVEDVASRLRLDHLATFFQRTATS
jgi:hypothetical protein